MSRNALALGFVVLCLIASPVAAGPVTEVEQVPGAFRNAFKTGDLDGITALYAPDASFLPTVGPARLDGRDAIRGYYQRVFANSKSRDIIPANERWQKFGDIVVRSNDVRIEQELADGRAVVTLARLSTVYQRGPSGWLIVNMNSAQQPQPAQAPAR